MERKTEREKKKERDTGEKWTASERRQPRATSRAATLLREGSLSVSLLSSSTYCFFKKMYKVARAPRERKLLAMFPGHVYVSNVPWRCSAAG